MKNTMMAAAILTFLLAAARTAAAQEAAPADSANKPAIQSALHEAAKPEQAVETPAPKSEPKAAPKPEAKAETPAKTEPEAEAPVAKPAPKAEPKPEMAPKPVEPAKELTPCAKAFVPLADNYKKAYDELQIWIRHIDAQTAGASAAISRIQGEIEKNEAAITKLKIEGGSESSEKGRELAKDNKKLWADLSASRKERAALCEGFTREAIQRAKRYQVEIIETLEGIKAQTK